MRRAQVLQAIEQALACHREGRLQEAERGYRGVLRQDPDNAHVLNFLGILAYQTRRHEDAARFARRAIELNGGVANFHNTHGLALQALQRAADAEACFRQALALDADFAEAYTNLGNVLLRKGQAEDAAASYQRALGLQPGLADAHCGLGKAWIAQGRRSSARESFERAIALEPKQADAHNQLGLLLTDDGELERAETALRRAIMLSPDYAEAHNNLGNVLRLQGKLDAAIAAYQRALALDPHPAIYCNLGNLLDESARLDEAAALYGKALSLDPAYTRAARHLGAVLATQGRPGDALAVYQKAAPTDGLRLQSALTLPVIPSSVEDLHAWRQRVEDEIDLLEHRSLIVDDPLSETLGTNFFLSYHGLGNRDLHTKVARLFARACPGLLWSAPHCAAVRAPRDKIRVGFISHFLHRHSIGKTSRGLMAKLSRDEFEVHALFVPPLKDDEISRFIRANSDRATVLPAALEGARNAIAALELDVLFYQDIGMERFTYFLAFSRLAPVQCVSFGHPDTTGIDNMDYFVSSDLYEAAGAHSHYSEKLHLARGLGTLAYYYRPQLSQELKPRQAFGLHDEMNLYLCPQALFKFHPELDALLGEILHADPRARLVVLSGRVPLWAELLRERFRRAFGSASDRVLFLPEQSSADFTNLVATADVMLDTLHFNGMNTSLEALAVGTPVVTLPGALQRGRHTAGMYARMGLGDAVARDKQHYVRIALDLGTDPARRRKLKQELLARNHVLFEDLSVVREFERFFREAVKLASPTPRRSA